MAAAFEPPFNSSRQDQANWRGGYPTFGGEFIGDSSATEPGFAAAVWVKYDGLIENSWTINAGDPHSLSVSKALPASILMLKFLEDRYEVHVPQSIIVDEECSAPNTGSIRSAGGAWFAKNIRTAQNVQAASFTLAGSDALCYDQTGSVNTPSDVPTPILAFATVTNYAYIIKVLVTYSKASDGSTASYSFEYKCKNVAGVATNSATALSSSIIDAGLAGTSVGIGLSGTSTVIVGTGLLATAIKWAARMQVVAIPI